MGTTYNVQYADSLQRNLQTELDSILKLLNKSMSTYDPSSSISQFNFGEDTIFQIDIHFAKVFELSKEVYALSDGYFNPTVFPLVKYWGFAGGEKPQNPDSTLIDSLLLLCDFEAIDLKMDADRYILQRKKLNIQLDFSAIAKGYGVDLLSLFLEKNAIENYLVEIGGEVRFKGLNSEDENWSVGIDFPSLKAEERSLAAIITSKEDAIATSGNYRNHYIRNNTRYAHILNPKTGYSSFSSILSATVLSDNCAKSDALATALMIGGEALFDKIEAENGIGILLIKSETDNNGEEILSPVMSQSLIEKTEYLLD